MIALAIIISFVGTSIIQLYLFEGLVTKIDDLIAAGKKSEAA
jgi:hypothetical protein